MCPRPIACSARQCPAPAANGAQQDRGARCGLSDVIPKVRRWVREVLNLLYLLCLRTVQIEFVSDQDHKPETLTSEPARKLLPRLEARKIPASEDRQLREENLFKRLQLLNQRVRFQENISMPGCVISPPS
jgi:hypothetical protein